MVLSASGSVQALLHIPALKRVAIFAKTLTTLPKGMVVGIETYLQHLIVELHEAGINHAMGRGKMGAKYVTDNIAAVQYNEMNWQEGRWTEIRKSKP